MKLVQTTPITIGVCDGLWELYRSSGVYNLTNITGEPHLVDYLRVAFPVVSVAIVKVIGALKYPNL